MKFSLVRREEKVELVGPDKVERTYTIREITGKERDEYLNGLAKRMVVSDAGKPIGVKDFSGLQAALLSKCLFDDKEQLVPFADIQAMPATTCVGLFNVAQRLNGLDEAGTEEAKNG